MSERPGTKKVWLPVILVYAVCLVFRLIEYFFIRTDSTFLGEAFIHKLLGIAVLFVAARAMGYSAGDIGFSGKKALVKLLAGLCLGAFCYAIAYRVELLVLSRNGLSGELSLYVTGYSVDGNIGKRPGLVFFVICILGNIINVLMEEGVFRGLFQKILESRHAFIVAAVIASVLFGLWHCVGPLRSFADGASNGMQCAVNLAILVGTSTLVGFKYAMLARLTGSLYAGMADHFVNNTIINILHVTGSFPADELQFIRISVAQTLSFVIVLIIFCMCKRPKDVGKTDIWK